MTSRSGGSSSSIGVEQSSPGPADLMIQGRQFLERATASTTKEKRNKNSNTDWNRSALRCFTKALKQLEPNDSRRVELKRLLGDAHVQSQAYERALRQYQGAMDIAIQTGLVSTSVDIIWIQYGLSVCYSHLDRYAKASEALQRAVTVASSVSSSSSSSSAGISNKDMVKKFQAQEKIIRKGFSKKETKVHYRPTDIPQSPTAGCYDADDDDLPALFPSDVHSTDSNSSMTVSSRDEEDPLYIEDLTISSTKSISLMSGTLSSSFCKMVIEG
jgi:hypothetical protein